MNTPSTPTPSTPTNQPTKSVEPNAPTKLSQEQTCRGCEECQPNQLAHVGPGGCLEETFNAMYGLK